MSEAKQSNNCARLKEDNKLRKGSVCAVPLLMRTLRRLGQYEGGHFQPGRPNVVDSWRLQSLQCKAGKSLGGAACSETWPRTRIVRTPPEYLTAISCLTWLIQHEFHQKTLDSRWIAALNERFAWDHCGHRLWTEKNLALLIASLLYLEVGLSAPNT